MVSERPSGCLFLLQKLHMIFSPKDARIHPRCLQRAGNQIKRDEHMASCRVTVTPFCGAVIIYRSSFSDSYSHPFLIFRVCPGIDCSICLLYRCLWGTICVAKQFILFRTSSFILATYFGYVVMYLFLLCYVWFGYGFGMVILT
jgi:hypothetical protein